MTLTKPVINGRKSKILRWGLLPVLITVLLSVVGFCADKIVNAPFCIASSDEVVQAEERVSKRIDSLDERNNREHKSINSSIRRMQDRYDEQMNRIEERVYSTMNRMDRFMDRVEDKIYEDTG